MFIYTNLFSGRCNKESFVQISDSARFVFRSIGLDATRQTRTSPFMTMYLEAVDSNLITIPIPHSHPHSQTLIPLKIKSVHVCKIERGWD